MAKALKIGVTAWSPLASSDLILSTDQLQMLDEASRIDLGFPHDFYEKELPRTSIYGGLRDRILV